MSNQKIGLFIICACFFMTSLDITIVNVALPAIATNLHAPLNQVIWIINGYLLVYAALVIPGGRLGDIVGQRSVFIIGLVLFTVASVLCVLSQNILMLIGARILQGIGCACISAPSLALLNSIVPAERRGAALGVYSSMVALAGMLGPVVSGLLVADLSWHWIFLVNVPIGAVLIIGTLVAIPRVKMERPHNLDIVGVILSVLGLFGISFAVVEGPAYSWGNVVGPFNIWVFLLGGIIFLIAFFFWERSQSEPFLPLSLFKNWTFSNMAIVYVILSFAAFGNSLLFVLYLESALGLNALLTGFMLVPQTLAVIVIAPLAGKLSDKIGGKYVLLSGILCYALGLSLFAWFSTTHANMFIIVVTFVIAGVGLVCTMGPLMGEALRDVQPPMIGTASGVLNMSRLAGGSIGVAIITGFLQSHLLDAVHSQMGMATQQVPTDQRQSFADYIRSLMQNNTLPHTTLSESLQHLAAQIYAESFVSAMHITLIMLVILLLIATLLVLTVKKRVVAAASPAVENVEVSV